MTTLTAILARHAVGVADDLIADIDVPVLTGVQRQGDVGIFPRPPIGAAEIGQMTNVPATGVAVVRGEFATGANSHILSPEPGSEILWAPASPREGSVLLGVLHVPDGAVAWLIHTDEHGANGIGPGTYTLRGKREQADEIRRVAD